MNIYEFIMLLVLMFCGPGAEVDEQGVALSEVALDVEYVAL